MMCVIRVLKDRKKLQCPIAASWCHALSVTSQGVASTPVRVSSYSENAPLPSAR